MKLNEFPTMASFETAPEFPSTFFSLKLFEFKTKGDFLSGGGGHFHINLYGTFLFFRVSVFSINS